MRPAETIPLQMWPLDSFEFETPGLEGRGLDICLIQILYENWTYLKICDLDKLCELKC